MKKILTAALLLTALGGTVAVAGPIEDRQALMKSIAGAAKNANAIAKAPTYDAAAAKAQMQIIVDGAAKLPSLFPKGSDTGATKTKAGPAIWTDAAGFKAASDKMGKDAAAAGAAADATAFAAAFKTVTADCSACHKDYRTP